MSEETPNQPPAPSAASASDAPRVRRISNPRPKKAAKHAPARQTAKEESPAPVKEAAAYPVFNLTEAPASPRPAPEESATVGDWPEPEPASSGESPAADGPKRGKRRRKKGKGGGGTQNAPQAGEGEPISAANEDAPAAEASSARPLPQAPQTRPPAQAQRPKFDPEMLTKLAWKIYLSEVSEEGVALIGDNDAKELSRRCFRLAEIFMEEQSRRR